MPVEKTPFYIRIIDVSHTSLDKVELNQEDLWDRADEYTSHSIEGFTATTKEGFFDLIVDYSPKEGIPYYLLYVLYSTGDSFHREYGCIEYIDLYQKEEEAFTALSQLLDQSDKEDDVTYLGSNKKPCKIQPPWFGYFNSLESIEVERVYLK